VIAGLAEAVAGIEGLPDQERTKMMLALLRTEVHDVVLQLTAEVDALPADRLGELAAAVRAAVPEGAEDRLPPRVRTLIRLLRRDALEPAWVLAEDNAAGVVRPTRAQSMWAGGSFASPRLPLPTVVDDDGRAYAWLPGFRDPRWGVPDDVYNIDNEVVLRSSLDVVLLRRGELRLSGGGYLGLLETSAQDSVVVVLNGPDGAEHRVAARRVRRPDDVRLSGPELTRLAWAGWHAQVDVAALSTPGTWRVSLEVTERGAQRTSPLGRKRGPLAQPEMVAASVERRGYGIRVDSEQDGRLLVRVTRLSPSARLVPRPVRNALRAIRSR
jgi:poly(ribitol-phosphate) beta-N-acetylglucosaminyltransferase